MIWPEHTERLEQFEKAASLVKGQALQLIEGDGVQLLSEIAASLPKQYTLCVFHTHVANQFSDATKVKLIETITRLGQTRDVAHLYNNIWDVGQLHLDYYVNSQQCQTILADIDGHGSWFQWKHHD